MSVRSFLDFMMESSAIVPVLDLLDIAAMYGLKDAKELSDQIKQGRSWQLQGEGFNPYEEREWGYPNIEERVELIKAQTDPLLSGERINPRMDWIKDELKKMEEINKNLISEIDCPNPSLLVADVGTCHGEMLFYLAKELPKIDFIGMEPNEFEFNIGDRVRIDYGFKNILDWIHGSIWDYPLNEERFDVIMFNEVLEHTVNPSKLIQSAIDRLDLNGFILGSVPFGFIERGLDLKLRCHVHQFSPDSLLRLFGPRMNVEISALQHINNIGYLMFKAQRRAV